MPILVFQDCTVLNPQQIVGEVGALTEAGETVEVVKSPIKEVLVSTSWNDIQACLHAIVRF